MAPLNRRAFLAGLIAMPAIAPQCHGAHCEHRVTLKERAGWLCAHCGHREVFCFTQPLDGAIQGWERAFGRIYVFTANSVYEAC
jgi:hypothetical protein